MSVKPVGDNELNDIHILILTDNNEEFNNYYWIHRWLTNDVVKPGSSICVIGQSRLSMWIFFYCKLNNIPFYTFSEEDIKVAEEFCTEVVTLSIHRNPINYEFPLLKLITTYGYEPSDILTLSEYTLPLTCKIPAPEVNLSLKSRHILAPKNRLKGLDRDRYDAFLAKYTHDLITMPGRMEYMVNISSTTLFTWEHIDRVGPPEILRWIIIHDLETVHKRYNRYVGKEIFLADCNF